MACVLGRVFRPRKIKKLIFFRYEARFDFRVISLSCYLPKMHPKSVLLTLQNRYDSPAASLGKENRIVYGHIWWGYIAKIFVQFAFKSVHENVPVGQGYGPRTLNFSRFLWIFLIFRVAEIRVYPGYIRDISDVQDGAVRGTSWSVRGTSWSILSTSWSVRGMSRAANSIKAKGGRGRTGL